jgi:hypothetical protein
MVVLPSSLAVLGNHPSAGCKLTVVSNHPTGVTVGPEVLSWEKTKRAGIADGADVPSSVFRAVRLGAIFKDKEPVLACEPHDRIHVCGGAV